MLKVLLMSPFTEQYRTKFKIVKPLNGTIFCFRI